MNNPIFWLLFETIAHRRIVESQMLFFFFLIIWFVIRIAFVSLNLDYFLDKNLVESYQGLVGSFYNVNYVVYAIKKNFQFHRFFKRYFPRHKLLITPERLEGPVKLVKIYYDYTYEKTTFLNNMAWRERLINDHQYMQFQLTNHFFLSNFDHHQLMISKIQQYIILDKFHVVEYIQLLKYISLQFLTIALSSGKNLVKFNNVLQKDYSQVLGPFTLEDIKRNRNSTLTVEQAKNFEYNSNIRPYIKIITGDKINITEQPVEVSSHLLGSDLYMHEILPGSGFHRRCDNVEILKSQDNILTLFKNPVTSYFSISNILSEEKYQVLSKIWDDSSESKKAEEKLLAYLRRSEDS